MGPDGCGAASCRRDVDEEALFLTQSVVMITVERAVMDSVYLLQVFQPGV